ncbi:MAG: DUF2188 domain-containing protein [Acidobacteriota bacterium]
MPRKRDVHVVPHGDRWAVKREGSQRSSKVTDTKREAEGRGRDLARKNKVELVIHRRDGTIQDSDSYGPDPFPPRDKRR